MQSFDALLWLMIPFIFIVLVFVLMMLPRTRDSKKGFYAIIVIGTMIVVGYFIIRTFIIPP